MSTAILELTKQTLTLGAGETFEQEFAVTDSAGTAVDITNAKIYARVKAHENGQVLIAMANTAGGGGDTEIEITSGAGGTYKIKCVPTDTRGWSPSDYVFDVWIDDVPNSGDSRRHVAMSDFVVESVVYSASDANNTSGAGGPSILDSDFTGSDGRMVKTGAGAYSVVKENRAASSAPGTGDDNTQGYGVGSFWWDTTAAKGYTCLSAATGAADWNQIDGAGGGGGSGEANTASSAGGTSLYKTKTGVDLEFKGITAGVNIGVTAGTNDLTIDGLSAAEIKTAYEGNADTNEFSDAEQTKLAGIETAADVTDATNVAAAGAVMADGTGDDLSADLVFSESADHSATPAAGKGQLWVRSDTPNILVFTDDAGTDTALGAGGGGDLVDDTSPQLGGQLDVNGNAIGDGTRELLTFVEDASAVNHVEIENEATGSGPTVRSTGDDTNIPLSLDTKGTGQLILSPTSGEVAMNTADNKLFLDIDQDSYIRGLGDDRVLIYAGGQARVDVQTTSVTISGQLNCSGGAVIDDYLRLGVDATTYTSAFTVSALLGPVYTVDTSGGAFTVTLMSAVSGYEVTIVDVTGDCTAENLTIVANTGDAILGGTSFKLTADYGTIRLLALDATNWTVVGGNKGYTIA